MRNHVVRGLTDSELEHAWRELAASLALSQPGSPIRAPIQAQLSAIDTELQVRAPAAEPQAVRDGNVDEDGDL